MVLDATTGTDHCGPDRGGQQVSNANTAARPLLTTNAVDFTYLARPLRIGLVCGDRMKLLLLLLTIGVQVIDLRAPTNLRFIEDGGEGEVTGTIQAAVDAGQPHATYLLTPGRHYGAVTLGDKGGILTTKGFATQGPIRADAGLAILSRIHVQSGTWTLRGIEVTSDSNDLVLLGEDALNPVVDRVYIHGDAATGAKRGVTLNSKGGLIRDSLITDIKRTGQDAVGIGGWNGPGPYRSEKNTISASGSSIMFGGADPSVPGLVPADIQIVHNVLTKDPAWRGQWLVKNGFELKNARRVLLAGNIIEQVWTSGQTGYGLTLTVRNQDGGCPWCVIEDVTVRENEIRLVGAGVQILGRDNLYPSGVMARVSLVDNRFSICNSGANRQVEISGGPEGLTLSGNTFAACAGQYLGTFLAFSGPPVVGLALAHNWFQEGEYGIHSPDAGLGTETLERYAPAYVWTSNTVTTWNYRWIPYPSDTLRVPRTQ